MWRFLLLAVVALGLAPGVWWRTHVPPPDYSGRVTFRQLSVAPHTEGAARFLRGWEIDSPDQRFGGYSALLLLADDTFLAGSDRGELLRFAKPGKGAEAPRFDRFVRGPIYDKRLVDLESLTQNPATGQIWGGYEYANAIVRYDPGAEDGRKAEPPAMADWSSNSGPETLLRLRDGRFLVIAEGNADDSPLGNPALLFPGDPTEGGQPLAFHFKPASGFRPVDATQLPDGRVLILQRKLEWKLPPGFATKLAVADPAAIRAGQSWLGREVLTLRTPDLKENYEGIAVEPSADGTVMIWLISDDNTAKFQRTLLLELEWNPREKARDPGRTPR